ncbi:RAMP superfamily CRISPR-associated protein [Hydrogenothermus marinus]|uniref:CRISPR-associated protein Cmr2 n=1 Tax=Hydrogenothermus marinus TaxID=133270 RepID=A0A3M0BN42_9AQUI|nr:RAMP superfamily CRISPR-associated protein [Hydrogenothermus marinus]RMA97946.1 CRISPR-associated protein Cmr2 [Hydrogenothermus marinus]
MHYETILNKTEDDLSYYIHFCKIYVDYKETKIKDTEEDLKKLFPFWKNPNPTDKNFKNYKLKNFPLEYLKYNLEQENKKQINIQNETFNNIAQIQNLKEFTKLLIPYSFAIEAKFKLKSPYFSHDDDEFYLINNPCLKDKAFKVPMIRGSSWKGVLKKSAIDIINENNKDNDSNKTIENLKSYFRIFGVGSENFRELINDKNLDKNKLKLFFLLEGISIKKDDNLEDIFKKYQEQNIQAQKGRAIFYPTFFDSLSLEVINPHDRRTKAGKNPIYYEVVPKETKGKLQIVYIPFDKVMAPNETIKEEAERDLNFLKKCIKKAFENGIGAKTKLGWGKCQDIDFQCFWSNGDECGND